jgi:flavin-dependent dehydrogenase
VHCTGVLAFEAYEELDIPRDPVLNTLRTVRFFAPSGAVVRHTTPTIEALVIDRRLFDQQLHLRAQAAGVTLRTAARAMDLSTGTGSVRVSLADGGELRARACVLACGANYALQRRIGLGLPTVFLQSAQVEWPAARVESVEVHFGREVAPGGFAWVVPVQRGSGSMARIGLMCDAGAGQQFARFAERIGSRCGVHAPPVKTGTEPRLKMLPLAPLRKTYAARILTVGDAAGLVKATTGGGIYYSLVSAGIAADVLGEALSADSLTDRRLREYQRLWRKRLGAELDAQLSLRRLAHEMTDQQIDALFELAQTDGVMPIVRRTAKFNRHRDVIVSLLKHPPVRRLLFNRLARGSTAAVI